MGEGGALLVNSENDILRAEIIREKGTNCAGFSLSMTDKYTWVDCGSSYLPSELSAAYLYPQLNEAKKINDARLERYDQYYSGLKELEKRGRITLPAVPDTCTHNAHMFYIKTKSFKEQCDFIGYMKSRDISCMFHYIPLHGCPAGERFGEFHGEDRYTTKESERLLRLPLFYNLSPVNQRTVIATLLNYFS